MKKSVYGRTLTGAEINQGLLLTLHADHRIKIYSLDSARDPVRFLFAAKIRWNEKPKNPKKMWLPSFAGLSYGNRLFLFKCIFRYWTFSY